MSRESSQTNGVLDALALRRQQREELKSHVPHESQWIEALGPIDIQILTATLAGRGLGELAVELGVLVEVLEARRQELKEQWQEVTKKDTHTTQTSPSPASPRRASDHPASGRRTTP